MTHSADLQWQLVRRNSKFLQLRNGVRLSSDPFNNNARWTRRQAGFINDKAVVLKVAKGAIVATVKNGTAKNQPKKAFAKQVFAADAKPSTVSKAVAAVRPDLADTAFRRSAKLLRVIKRESKVRAARKERSAKITFKRKAVRPKRK